MKWLWRFYIIGFSLHLAIYLASLLPSSSSAGNIKYGRSTTFDSTSYGGGWSCYGPSGSCGAGTFANHFDAACAGGSTSNDTALSAWWTYGHSLNTTLAKLRIPVGSVCSFGTNQSLVCNTLTDDATTLIQNALIWGYGVSWDRMQLGGNGLINSGLGFSSALINQANPGDTTVVVNDGNISLFAVGNWILVTALAHTNLGDSTHKFFEHRQITAINGTTISFSGPLVNTYKTTYPQFDAGDGGNPNHGGPATIMRYANCFATTVTYLGLTLTTPVASVQNNMTGKSITLQDMTIYGGLGPGNMIAAQISGSYVAAIEVDKHNEFFSLTNSYVAQTIEFQSESTTPSYITNTRIMGSLSGTPGNLVVTGSYIAGDLQVGAKCCGNSTSLVLNNTYYGNGRPAGQETAKATLSYSAGVFTISLTNFINSVYPGMWEPGRKYFFGDSNGDNNCTPLATFTVTDVVQVSTNVEIRTDLVGALPTPTCANEGGSAYSTYARYELVTLIQNNVTHGGAALLDWGKMVAPP